MIVIRGAEWVVYADVVPVIPGDLCVHAELRGVLEERRIAFHGRLEFDPHGLWLHGGERGHELRVEVAYDEIVSVARDWQDRIGPCQAIRIQTRAANDLLIASIAGVGVLGEIQDTLCHTTHG